MKPNLKIAMIAFAYALLCAPVWGARLHERFDAEADSLAAVLIAEPRRGRQRVCVSRP